ncbi:hypothetical protein AVEN_235551-1 [Araneus ventricosus]|uniref:Uncharacterized protein n=1 Tax=Araneus ventricosus TaxID=182803 RepID=A0A4Y2ITC7_ARAVE|nr:hypothetical protein AVEN_235551-1 [Araneus ventricosus]
MPLSYHIKTQEKNDWRLSFQTATDVKGVGLHYLRGSFVSRSFTNVLENEVKLMEKNFFLPEVDLEEKNKKEIVFVRGLVEPELGAHPFITDMN